MSEWTRTARGGIPEGVELEVIAPSGDTRRLVFKSGLWWLPDMSMYCYFVPTFWRASA